MTALALCLLSWENKLYSNSFYFNIEKIKLVNKFISDVRNAVLLSSFSPPLFPRDQNWKNGWHWDTRGSIWNTFLRKEIEKKMLLKIWYMKITSYFIHIYSYIFIKIWMSIKHRLFTLILFIRSYTFIIIL